MNGSTTIIVRHVENLWQVTDLASCVTRFEAREVAVAAAYRMLPDNRGIIEVYDALGMRLEAIDLRTHERRR